MGKFADAYTKLQVNTDKRNRSTLERHQADRAAREALDDLLANLDEPWDERDRNAYEQLQAERME